MTTIKNKFIFIGIIIFCILALLFAFFVEYGLKHLPCNLCLIERIPYMATIILVSIVLILSKYEKIILVTIGLFFIIGTIVSFYHFGIEQGFFNESLVCDLGSNNKATSAKDLLKELNVKNISCKDVIFRVFGFSLATFNTIISFLISVIMLRTGLNYDKN
ncbi:disulfide bond formation protein B [Pelagibacteraceae bacterium]|nr:disulfide bond formation protein B [Pelagibacteraceae bacterium]